jgi:butyryl-CoA dehydrogenase
MVANAKKAALFAAGAASQKYLDKMVDQQEIMGALADMIIEAYAMESCVIRTQKMLANGGDAALATAMTQVYITGAMERLEAAAKKVIAAVAEGDMLRTQMMVLRRLFKYEPMNVIVLQQKIAQKVIDSGRYQIA